MLCTFTVLPEYFASNNLLLLGAVQDTYPAAFTVFRGLEESAWTPRLFHPYLQLRNSDIGHTETWREVLRHYV